MRTCVRLAVTALLVVTPDVAAQNGDEQLKIDDPPKISGSARVGSALTATEGDWTPSGGTTATYQWRRCSGDGSCTDIEGAVNRSFYVITRADAGYSLRIRLTVTRGQESDSAESEPTETVPPDRPSNTKRPALAGVAREGQLLTASPGEWSGTSPLFFAYNWQRCDPSGHGCDPIAEAEAATYALSAADVGTTVRVVVIASNAGGSSSARSQPTDLVERAPLVNLAPPSITGVAELDRVLIATPGRWLTSGPIDFLYRWLRCKADGSACDPIPGATSGTYQVRPPDLGFRLRVRVTAISDAGGSTRDSPLTGVVPVPPGSSTAALPGAVLMRPFPRVRIKGYFTSSGAVLQLVTVRAPARARIAVACRGRDCPFHRRTRRAHSLVRLRSLERLYRAGTRLTFRVSKPARIGKHTRIRIRAGRPPSRRDRCLMPSSKRPVPCPAATSTPSR